MRASIRKRRAIEHSLIISTIFDSRFLKGKLRKINNAISTEVNIRIGRAYIGRDEKIPMTSA